MTISMDVRRFGEATAVVDIKGEVTAACELTRLDEAITIYDSEESALDGVVR
jgi:anti-anti-sigma regulatory factor